MDQQKIEAVIKYVDAMQYEPTIRRSVEIAFLGKFSICFTGSKEGAAFNWSKIANELDLVAYFMTPCPCGNLADPRRACNCTTSQIQAHHQTISVRTALLADLHLEVPNLQVKRIPEESFAESVKRVQKAVFKTLALSDQAKKFLSIAVKNLDLSAVREQKTRQIACAIACLDASPSVEPHHIAEAIQYRPKELFDFLV